MAGVRSSETTHLIRLCEHPARNLKNQLVTGNTNDLLYINRDRGRKSYFKDIEAQIVEKVEKAGIYQPLQQIADMVNDIFGVKASIMAEGRLLKNGIPKLKAGSLPAKTDTNSQRSFYESVL